jgi:hypothetical protein
MGAPRPAGAMTACGGRLRALSYCQVDSDSKVTAARASCCRGLPVGAVETRAWARALGLRLL